MWEVTRTLSYNTQKTRTFLNVWVEVLSADCLPFFQDASPGYQKIHLRIPLPAGVRKADAELQGCLLDQKKVPAEMIGQAVEFWRGTWYAHVLVRGEKLASKGLIVQVKLEITKPK